jgi:hypothetical protein
MLLAFVTAGVAALAWSLEHRKPKLGRWFLIGVIVVLLRVWGARFNVAEALFLLFVPTALAAVLISLSAALVATAGESVLLIAVLNSAPLLNLFAPHAAEYRRLFQLVKLDLGAEGSQRSNEELLLDAYAGAAPTELVETMWAYGRYLLIASSRPGGNPCPLLGLWGGEYQGF